MKNDDSELEDELRPEYDLNSLRVKGFGSGRDGSAFRPSEIAKQHVADLIRREKITGLTADETSELNHYMELEHLMRLAKARARKHIAKG